jgi:hypothetical protein
VKDAPVATAHREKAAKAHSDECEVRVDRCDRRTPSSPLKSLQDTEHARRSYRRVVMTTCQAHGAAGFTNLLVTREDGIIVLNPHVANCCVLRLDEQAATTLHDILTEWLG